MLTLPVAVAVKVTEHVALAKVHGLLVKLPVAPVAVNMTVPVGAIAVPRDVSVTDAVQLVDWLTTTVLGEQLTLVAVVRRLTTTVAVLLVLPVCDASRP